MKGSTMRMRMRIRIMIMMIEIRKVFKSFALKNVKKNKN
jgi:hypothetical protein